MRTLFSVGLLTILLTSFSLLNFMLFVLPLAQKGDFSFELH